MDGNETEKKKIGVLLVEDNPADARLLQEALREAGQGSFELAYAKRLDEALARIGDDGLEVLLLDLSLPDSHGLETLARVQEAAPHLAIVVLTGNDDETVAVEAVRMGAQDYLFKGDTHGPLLVRAIYCARERERAEKERKRLIDKLQAALAQVKQLGGLLPICASCKSIRNDQGYWQQLEKYLDEHSEVQFTHGLCPHCARKLYPELYQKDLPTGESGK